ncbi:MAG TPA: penicillin-binding protein 2, partial [Nocardioidaceae bacterium]
MNKPIRTMSILCMVLFMALLLNSTYLQYFRAGYLNSRDDNKRVRDAEFSRKRGAILVGGNPIAESRPVKDEYKYLRTYPRPYKYAQVSGYYSYLYGRNAVELTQNEILSGSDPRLFVNRVVDLIGNSQPKGGSVSLTLNAKAQTAAFQGLQHLGPDAKGAVVALEPHTGKVLAMASVPSYDPNRLASHDFSATQEAWKKLTTNDSQPMLNRAIQTTYPPGSTFKVVTAAAALSTGQYNPQSMVKGGPVLDLPQTTIDLPNEAGLDCGSRITLTQALENSCNVTFGFLGLDLGDDVLREQARKFGFGDTYLEDLNGQVPSQFPQNPDPPQTALSAIGQFDVAATPLQMAMVVSGIANGGTVMRPYLVDEVRGPDLSVLEKTTPEPYRNAVSASVARDLTQMMVGVVNEGTGTTAQIPGIQVAGKTGTAQHGEDNPPYAWFISFAPADDPQVAVAVLVDDPSVPRSEISGSGLAA